MTFEGLLIVMAIIFAIIIYAWYFVLKGKKK